MFDGFREFVAGQNNHLIINLGNHDLELALPWVRQKLLQILAGDDAAARGRITLAFEGSGVAARVGHVKILCLHGNEVDQWNVTDYEKLRRIGRDTLKGIRVDPWAPNAGSRMVVEVMNSIKAEWPFVDLLKPETRAVPLVLLALKPEFAAKLKNIAGLLAVATATDVRMKAGLLGEPPPSTGQPVVTIANPLLTAGLEIMDGRSAALRPATSLLDQVEINLRNRKSPVDLLQNDFQTAYLGRIGDMWDQIVKYFRESRTEALRKTLKRLIDARLFARDQLDATFKDINETVGPSVDILITGHTHLERAFPRSGGGFYYNAGTWAGLMQIPTEVLDSEEQFERLFARIQTGRLSDLEDDGRVMRLNTVVAITKGPAGYVRSELLNVGVDDAGGPTLTSVPNSQWRA